MTQDRTVVLAVVVFLGMIGVIGLAGVVWLVERGAEGTAIAAVVGMPTTAIGALAGILALTHTNSVAVEQRGYKRAEDDLRDLAGKLGESTPVPPGGTVDG